MNIGRVSATAKMGNWMIKSALLLILVGICMGWGHEKVKLKDIQVLTLKHGAMTTGRRSSPVPQIKCVGGTARCQFTPKVVQCYNRGSDGYDVQWECKTDMDNDYRFGDITVTCEGYDYPDDPYVLKGSCGVRSINMNSGVHYRLYKRGGGGNHDYYHHDQSSDYGWNKNLYKSGKPSSDFITNICCGAVVVVIVYAIYKTCIQPRTNEARQRSNTNDDYHGRGPGKSPPPPGFRSDYNQGDSGYSGGTGFGDSCGSSSTRSGGSSGAGSGAGGFWTGAAAGGLLGYMFGNRGNNTCYGGYGGATYRPRPSTSWGSSGWGSSGSGGGFGSSSSSGSRSSSGFGGTSRR